MARKGSGFDPANPAAKTIGASRATIASDWLEANLAGTATIKLYTGQQELHPDLAAGRLDAMFGDSLGSYAWLRGPEGAGFEFVGVEVLLSECFRLCRYLHNPLRLLPAGAKVAGRDFAPARERRLSTAHATLVRIRRTSTPARSCAPGAGRWARSPSSGLSTGPRGPSLLASWTVRTPRTLQGFVTTNTAPTAKVYTDDARAYLGLPRDHEAVRHSVGEHVDGMAMAHTNGIESFWATLKRGYKGTYFKMGRRGTCTATSGSSPGGTTSATWTPSRRWSSIPPRDDRADHVPEGSRRVLRQIVREGLDGLDGETLRLARPRCCLDLEGLIPERITGALSPGPASGQYAVMRPPRPESLEAQARRPSIPLPPWGSLLLLLGPRGSERTSDVRRVEVGVELAGDPDGLGVRADGRLGRRPRRTGRATCHHPSRHPSSRSSCARRPLRRTCHLRRHRRL